VRWTAVRDPALDCDNERLIREASLFQPQGVAASLTQSFRDIRK
jgi:hypothetical protein